MLPEHRRHQPHLSLLELPCPCCERLIVPSIEPYTCAKHPWSRARRCLVGWFCGDCRLPVRVLRLYASHDDADAFKITLVMAAREAWVNGHAPDLPAWILPRPRAFKPGSGS
jgi:hypothetical protein